MAKSAKTTTKQSNDKHVRIDGKLYSTENISEVAAKTLNSLGFAERKIAELRGEMSLATTARSGFINILKNELTEVDDEQSESPDAVN